MPVEQLSTTGGMEIETAVQFVTMPQDLSFELGMH
jgi:hypothetical protein